MVSVPFQSYWHTSLSADNPDPWWSQDVTAGGVIESRVTRASYMLAWHHFAKPQWSCCSCRWSQLQLPPGRCSVQSRTACRSGPGCRCIGCSRMGNSDESSHMFVQPLSSSAHALGGSFLPVESWDFVIRQTHTFHKFVPPPWRVSLKPRCQTSETSPSSLPHPYPESLQGQEVKEGRMAWSKLNPFPHDEVDPWKKHQQGTSLNLFPSFLKEIQGYSGTQSGTPIHIPTAPWTISKLHPSQSDWRQPADVEISSSNDWCYWWWSTPAPLQQSR